ncbi:MAG: hypothetical protein WBY71_12320, partial [Nitrososphaeraceae archaeon]
IVEWTTSNNTNNVLIEDEEIFLIHIVGYNEPVFCLQNTLFSCYRTHNTQHHNNVKQYIECHNIIKLSVLE